MSASLMHIRDVGQGRPLVLLHGWSCAGQFFNEQVIALSGQVRCIVPDLPGHGKTGDGVALSVEAAADALGQYLARENLQDAVLCGWSLGALVAYALVERWGTDRFARVVSVDMSPKVLNTDDWRNGTRDGLDEAVNKQVLAGIVAGWEQMPAGIAKRLFASDRAVDTDLLSFAQAQIAKENPVLLKPMWASLASQDFRSLLQRLPLPLHLAVGLQSQLYGPGVHVWHQENVPELHLHAFENSGHAPHLEEGQRFNALLKRLVVET